MGGTPATSGRCIQSLGSICVQKQITFEDLRAAVDEFLSGHPPEPLLHFPRPAERDRVFEGWGVRVVMRLMTFLHPAYPGSTARPSVSALLRWRRGPGRFRWRWGRPQTAVAAREERKGLRSDLGSRAVCRLDLISQWSRVLRDAFQDSVHLAALRALYHSRADGVRRPAHWSAWGEKSPRGGSKAIHRGRLSRLGRTRL